MRERGSNTARPTEKGIGGLPIRSRPVDFGASRRVVPVDSARRFGRFRSISARRFGRVAIWRAGCVDSVDFGASIRSRPVAIWRACCAGRADLACLLCRSCRFGVLLVSRFVVPVVSIRSCLLCRSCRFGVLLVSRFGVPVVPIRSCRVEVKAQTQKKPDSSIGESGSAIARRRALLTFR